MIKPPLGSRCPWPDVMMGIALAAGSRSRDATTRVGAVVCTELWRIIGTGYNGPPAGSPDSLPMEGPARHSWVVHAEENALIQAVASLGTIDLIGCLLFSTHRPCAACVMRASHLGIAAIVWRADELDDDQRRRSTDLADLLGLRVGPLAEFREGVTITPKPTSASRDERG